MADLSGRELKAAARAALADHDGVVGVGLGEGTVRVYCRDGEAVAALPDEIAGTPVEAVVVGDITPQ